MSLINQIMDKVVEVHREFGAYPDELEMLVNRETFMELKRDVAAIGAFQVKKTEDEPDSIHGVQITVKPYMLRGQAPVWVLKLKGDDQKCFAFCPSGLPRIFP
jgi:hypothetical protein